MVKDGQGKGLELHIAPTSPRKETTTHKDSRAGPGVQLGKAISTLNDQAENLSEFQMHRNK